MTRLFSFIAVALLALPLSAQVEIAGSGEYQEHRKIVLSVEHDGSISGEPSVFWNIVDTSIDFEQIGKDRLFIWAAPGDYVIFANVLYVDFDAKTTTPVTRQIRFTVLGDRKTPPKDPPDDNDDDDDDDKEDPPDDDRSDKSKRVIIMVAETGQEPLSPAARAASTRLRQEGYTVLIIDPDQDPENLRGAIRAAEEVGLPALVVSYDGMIVSKAHMPDTIQEVIAKATE